MQNLRALPFLVSAALLVPAVPALAAPAYTSVGSTTYFGYAAATQPSTTPTGSGSSTTTPTPPATTTSGGATYSTGTTTYFLPGLGQWVAAQPSAPAPTSQGSGTSQGGSTGTATQGSGTSQSGTGASTGSSGSSGSTTTSSAPANETSLAAQFLADVNQARAQQGLGVLADSPVLDELALAKAQDMVEYGYVDHYSPRLGYPINQEEAAGFVAQSMGAENIAEAGTIQRALIDLESDPGHEANLMDAGFTQTGVAVLPVTGGVLVEELFAGPSF